MGTRDQIENLQERIKKRSGIADEPPDDENAPSISEDDAEALLEFSRQLDLLSSKYTDHSSLVKSEIAVQRRDQLAEGSLLFA